MTVLLRVSRLTAGYGDLQVLWGIDLQIGHGEWVAVIGSNGVGKSTLLKAIAGLLRPTDGSVQWQGRDVTSLSAAARVRQRPSPMRTFQVARRGSAGVPARRYRSISHVPESVSWAAPEAGGLNVFRATVPETR
jgi:ABC-type branched-subunit amino acid transport system ATPase component